MPIVKYTDPKGYKWVTEVPEGTSPTHYKAGIRLGPPDLSRLNLKDDQQRLLHNALVDNNFYKAPQLVGKRAQLRKILKDNQIETHFLNTVIGVFQEVYYGEMGK